MAEDQHAELSDEQLEAALNQAVYEQPEPAPEPEPEPDPEPEPAPAAVEGAPAQAVADAPEPVDVEAELRTAREAEMEARAKHFESVAGRLGGKIGFLEQKISQLSTRPAPEPEVSSDEYEQPRTARQVRQADDKVATWAVKRAAEDVSHRFVATHPDYAEHIPKLKDYMEAKGIDPAPFLTADDPAYVEGRIQQLLDEHYWHVQAEIQSARRAELLTKRATQTAKAVQAKQQASASASGSSPPPKPAPKSVDNMTLDEIDSELAKATRGAIW